MKTSTNSDSIIERDNIQSEGVFTIQFNSKMAKILSDGLYSDKIGAIIRELCCNSIDSHVEAGKSDLPIEIHLPNSFEPWFHVQDFGVGLDHEQVINIYTCYGASTKTDSNDFIGQLGLGSKSPFSYVDAFSVTATKNGIERQYSLHKNEQGMPSVALLGTKSTSEPNGVIVKIPVLQGDINRFAERAENIFQWFEVQPTITGQSRFVVRKPEMHYSGNGWNIRKPTGRHSYSYDRILPVALMGRVAYPIAQTSFTKLTESQSAAMQFPLILSFDIGELEVAASRESIGYDPRTQKNILAKIDILIEELSKSFEKTISAAKTEWEARKIFGDIFGTESLFRSELITLFKTSGLKWKGKLITESHISINTEDLWDKTDTPQIFSLDGAHRRPNNRTYHTTHTVSCSKRINIIFDDLDRGGRQRATYYRDNLDAYQEIIMFGPSPKKTIEQIVKMLGNPEYKRTSELPKKPIDKANRVDMLRFIGGDGKKAWQQISIDVEDGGTYVLLNHYTPTRNTKDIANFSELVRFSKNVGILKKNEEIYAPRGTFRKKLNDGDGWVEFSEMALTKLNNMLTPEMIQSISDSKEYHSAMTVARQAGIWTYTKNVKTLDKDGPYRRFVEAIEQLGKSANVANDRTQSLIQLANLFGREIVILPPSINATEIHKQFKKRYPLIELSFDRYSATNITENNIDIYLDYVRMCDEKYARQMASAAAIMLENV